MRVKPRIPTMMKKNPRKKKIEPLIFCFLMKNWSVPQVPMSMHIPAMKASYSKSKSGVERRLERADSYVCHY